MSYNNIPNTRNRSSFFVLSSAIVIIIINIICFILQNTVANFTEFFMLVSSDILVRPWILVTSMFLHGGSGHLFFNMYALFLFGTLVESKIGTKRFLTIYFISGILASLGFSLFHELILQSPGAALGASGGMMGILGVTIMILPNLRVLFFFIIPMSMRTAGIMFALIDLLGVFGIGLKGIANTAHLAGLAAGILYGYYLLKKKKEFHKRFSRTHKPSNRVITIKPNNNQQYKSDGLELSNEDIDDFIKNGRL